MTSALLKGRFRVTRRRLSCGTRDAEWARLEPLLPDRTPRRGGRWNDHRQVIDGILWRTRAGSPWRDVPPCYGDFRTLHGRHHRWSADGTWETILERLQADSDRDIGPEWAVGVDSTVVRAHRHAAGARHDPPKDVPAEKLAPLLPALPRHTGGWVE